MIALSAVARHEIDDALNVALDRLRIRSAALGEASAALGEATVASATWALPMMTLLTGRSSRSTRA